MSALCFIDTETTGLDAAGLLADLAVVETVEDFLYVCGGDA